MEKLAIYFSVGGVTRRMVEYMGIPNIELKPAIPYSDADILSVNPKARCNKEQERWDLRPECLNIHSAKDMIVQGMKMGFTAQTEIYLGFPLWNLKAPRLIFTLLDICQTVFKDNKINVFCTSGGSPVKGAELELKKMYPKLHWGKFQQFSFTSKPEEVKAWLR